MIDTKRNFSEVAEGTPGHDDKKVHNKPGRKPIESEPKSKRTAQNRAAQRAYRERKERKMKDLEDKVADLEDTNIKVSTESDLLKAQIDLLKRELSRYRGHLDFSDLKLPTSVGKLSNPRVKAESTGNSPQNQKVLAVDFPWSKDNLQNFSSTYDTGSALPDLVSGSSSSTSPANDNAIVSPDSNSSDSNALSLNLNLSPENQFNISSSFDEQVDPFCVQLNEACGSKQRPVPKFLRESNNVPPLDLIEQPKQVTLLLPESTDNSPFHTLFTPNESLADPFFAPDGNYNFVVPQNDTESDPLSFLNDNNFDVSMAFGNATNDLVLNQAKKDEDPLAGLTSEESAYDPFNQVNTDFNFNEFVKSSLPSDVSSRTNSLSDARMKAASSVSSYNTTSPAIREDDENEVVPGPAPTIRCAEIWDRITSHPRYTEIDIDGLCSELKSKAKCSEKGVVLDAKEVNSLIERSAMKRRS